MNATLAPYTFQQAVTDRFVVFETADPLEAMICIGAARVLEVIKEFRTRDLTILRITDGELVRDVTDDLMPEHPAPAEDRWSRADRRYDEMREARRANLDAYVEAVRR